MHQLPGVVDVKQAHQVSQLVQDDGPCLSSPARHFHEPSEQWRVQHHEPGDVMEFLSCLVAIPPAPCKSGDASGQFGKLARGRPVEDDRLVAGLQLLFLACPLVFKSRVVLVGLALLCLTAGCADQPVMDRAVNPIAADVTEPEDGSYTFIKTQDRGSERPVAWDPCKPIEYYVNTKRQPRQAAGLIDEALAEVTAASGLEFRYLGLTNVRPWRQSCVA